MGSREQGQASVQVYTKTNGDHRGSKRAGVWKL
jgi:hypothetical protein